MRLAREKVEDTVVGAKKQATTKGCYVFWLRDGMSQVRPLVVDPETGESFRIQLEPGFEYPLPLEPSAFRRNPAEPETITPGLVFRYDSQRAPIALREISEQAVNDFRATVRGPLMTRVLHTLNHELGASAVAALKRSGGDAALIKHYNTIVAEDQQVQMPGPNPEKPEGVTEIGSDRDLAEESLTACGKCGVQLKKHGDLKAHMKQAHPKKPKDKPFKDKPSDDPLDDNGIPIVR